MRHQIDGDQLMICADNFINLQESPALFIPLNGVDGELAQALLAESTRLKDVLLSARNALSQTSLRVGGIYDWNTDPDGITLLQGEAFFKIDEALKSL